MKHCAIIRRAGRDLPPDQRKRLSQLLPEELSKLGPLTRYKLVEARRAGTSPRRFERDCENFVAFNPASGKGNEPHRMAPCHCNVIPSSDNAKSERRASPLRHSRHARQGCKRLVLQPMLAASEQHFARGARFQILWTTNQTSPVKWPRLVRIRREATLASLFTPEFQPKLKG